MKISVVIPCRNERQHICEFLDSLLTQDLAPHWQLEILVADGMSDDGTREILDRYCAQNAMVRMIDNPGRIVSTGLNAAIRASNGEIIVRMDAHTVYARDYIRECVKALQSSGADNVGGPWVAEGRGLVGRAIAAAFRSPFCTGGGKAHDPGYEGEVDTEYQGCWARSVFDKVGVFDPNLVRNQDDEFNFRIRCNGGRVWQSPRIRSSYTPRASIRALFRQYLQYGFWKVAVIRKHRALASWRHAVPALFVGSNLALPLSIAVAALLGMRGVASMFCLVLAAELAIYLLACAGAALPFVRSTGPAAVLIVPVIVVHHIAYGVGFLSGVCKLAGRAADAPPPGEAFTALTR